MGNPLTNSNETSVICGLSRSGDQDTPAKLREYPPRLDTGDRATSCSSGGLSGGQNRGVNLGLVDLGNRTASGVSNPAKVASMYLPLGQSTIKLRVQRLFLFRCIS